MLYKIIKENNIEIELHKFPEVLRKFNFYTTICCMLLNAF